MTDTAESIDPGPMIFSPDTAAAPHQTYDTVRRTCPVARSDFAGSTTVYISRYEDVCWAMRHPEYFSSEDTMELGEQQIVLACERAVEALEGDARPLGHFGDGEGGVFVGVGQLARGSQEAFEAIERTGGRRLERAVEGPGPPLRDTLSSLRGECHSPNGTRRGSDRVGVRLASGAQIFFAPVWGRIGSSGPRCAVGARRCCRTPLG